MPLPPLYLGRRIRTQFGTAYRAGALPPPCAPPRIDPTGFVMGRGGSSKREGGPISGPPSSMTWSGGDVVTDPAAHPRAHHDRDHASRDPDSAGRDPGSARRGHGPASRGHG